jgi:hypothetical protein
MKKVLLIILITGLIAGCYYDSEEQLYPSISKGCDTTGITFSKSVMPVLQTNCLTCHSARDNGSSGGNVNLEDFTQLKQYVDQGSLYGDITHNSRNNPMPKNGAKLDTCSITKIKIWIDKGALNN